ncbi:MAG: hypothetical protein G01um1014106_168, partial [Parcubacteria group bacterium Gr01-1014_106]
SILEAPSGEQQAGFKRVQPLLGQVSASYSWFGNILGAIGSLVQPFSADPRYLGYKSGQQPGFDFFWGFTSQGYKPNVSRLYRGFKGIGGQNVTDVSQLGVVGRECPGDPFWVAFPRPSNVEIPPPYQTTHFDWDCFCRYDEQVACPTGFPPPLGVPIFTPGLNLHRSYGGTAGFISCSQCFGPHNIRKHDFYVGTKKGSHFGYPSMAGDSGYQECLRQSLGSPTDPQQIYGL